MKPVEDYNSVKEFVNEHRQMLERVLRHSSNAYARAYTWALINAGSDAPDIDQLQRELQAAKEVDLGQKFSNRTGRFGATHPIGPNHCRQEVNGNEFHRRQSRSP